MGGPVFFGSVLLSTLTDGSFALIVGLLLAEHWLAGLNLRPVLSEAARRQTIILLITTFAFAHLARPWFLASSMSGTTGFRNNLSLIPSILSSTHQGNLWYTNSFAIVLLAVIALGKPSSHTTLQSRWTTALTVIALIVIAFVKAASGHAADDGDFTRLETLQVLHVIATAIWSGSILVSGLIVLPRLRTATDPQSIWRYGARLSQVATYAVVAVLLTGVYTSDRELNGPLTSIWTTAWGKILLAKIALVVVALALGGTSRLICIGRSVTSPRLQLFLRLVFAESIAMALVLCLSGLLGNTSPATSMAM